MKKIVKYKMNEDKLIYECLREKLKYVIVKKVMRNVHPRFEGLH